MVSSASVRRGGGRGEIWWGCLWFPSVDSARLSSSPTGWWLSVSQRNRQTCRGVGLSNTGMHQRVCECVHLRERGH